MKLTKQELVEMIKEELDNIPLLLNEAWYSAIDLEKLRGAGGPKRKSRYKGLTGGRGRHYRGPGEGPITAANIEQRLGSGGGELSDRLKAELEGTKDINVGLDLVNDLSTGDYDELSLGALADATASTLGMGALGGLGRAAKVAKPTRAFATARPTQLVATGVGAGDTSLTLAGGAEAWSQLFGGGRPSAIGAGTTPPTTVAQADTSPGQRETSSTHWRPEEPTT